MDTTNTETQAPVITLTEAAIKEVKRLVNVQGITEGGLRLVGHARLPAFSANRTGACGPLSAAAAAALSVAWR